LAQRGSIGRVTDDDTPVIVLEIAGRKWAAIVDTGFNGDFELPEMLRSLLPHERMGQTLSYLAGGQQILEDAFLVEIPFDGEIVLAEISFVPGDQILIGTRVMRDHRFEIDFPSQTLRLERAGEEP
jgi:predicted aspartyl protease